MKAKTFSKISMVALSCLSLSTLVTTSIISPAHSETSVGSQGVLYAQRIAPEDRFENRDREDIDQPVEQYRPVERYELRKNRWGYRRCEQLGRSIVYLERARDELRNQGEYRQAQFVNREYRAAQTDYRAYCNNRY